MKRLTGVLSGLIVLTVSLSGCATSERIESDLVQRALAPQAPRAMSGRRPQSIVRLGAGDALGSSVMTRYVSYRRTGDGRRTGKVSASAENGTQR